MNQRIENILKTKGVNPTAMRILVLEYLVQQSSAVSLQDLEADFYHADRITLYRTLKTFQEKGVIHDIQDGTDTTKYALCAEACEEGLHNDLHMHFYCTSCEVTRCLPTTAIQVALPEKFTIKELRLTATGLCNQCTVNNAI